MPFPTGCRTNQPAAEPWALPGGHRSLGTKLPPGSPVFTPAGSVAAKEWGLPIAIPYTRDASGTRQRERTYIFRCKLFTLPYKPMLLTPKDSKASSWTSRHWGSWPLGAFIPMALSPPWRAAYPQLEESVLQRKDLTPKETIK